MNAVVVGVSFGQNRATTGLCIAEVDWRDRVVHYIIRFLRTLPPTAVAPEAAQRMRSIYEGIPAAASRNLEIIADVTDHGESIVEVVRKQIAVRVIAVHLTPGAERHVSGGFRDQTLRIQNS